MTYNSIFNSSNIITKKDLCFILNLDINRPNLMFSPAEINKAYRLRTLKVHPDSQARNGNNALPKEICEAAFNDCILARDYLLSGQDNIPGKGLLDKANHFEAEDWVDFTINTLHGIKSAASPISDTVFWFYYLSSSLPVVIALSTFSDNQLNFRYVNEYSEALTLLRPFLKEIDASLVAQFLRLIKAALEKAESLKLDAFVTPENIQIFMDEIKQLSPELYEKLNKEDKLNKLIAAIRESGKEIKNTLTDDFIDRVQYIVGFWPQLIANMPSWSNIMGVYFISLTFTATSLPKFFNTLKVIAEIILQQKGTLAFALTALPLLLLSAIMLPVNLAVQLSIALCWVALKTAAQILINGLQMLGALLSLPFALIPNNRNSLAHTSFSLFEGSFNLFIRLTLNVAIELLDSVLFLLSNQNLLISVQEGMNEKFDEMLDSIRPEKAKPVPELALIRQETKEPQEKTERISEVRNEQGFFPNLKFLNDEDLWLNDLIKKTQEDNAQEQESNTAALA